MKINKNNIADEDIELANQVLNDLRMKNYVIGNPAEALKKTLKQLEDKRDSVEKSPILWNLNDKELVEQINLTKAGIEGEIQLSEFLANLLKHNDRLQGIVGFGSLAIDLENNDKDYIPDSDFLIVYKNNFLIIDAKNISTNPKVPIHIVGNSILTDTDKPKPILETVHSSIRVWENYFNKNSINFNSIKNIICIVNKSGAYITDPVDSDMELIHIASLNDYLMEWVNLETDQDYVELNTLTQIAKCQVRKEKSGLDLTTMRKIFKI